MALNIDDSDRIEAYKERLDRYHETLREDKEKILKKYGITKEIRAKLRNQERDNKRQQVRAQKQL